MVECSLTNEFCFFACITHFLYQKNTDVLLFAFSSAELCWTPTAYDNDTEVPVTE